MDSLRERKKLRTKVDLEQAAMRLFAERGYDAVTVDDIAAAAEVSARTFFRHFGSKEDVLVNFHRERLDDLRAHLRGRPQDESPLTAVRNAVVATAEDYESMRDDLFLRARVMADTPSLLGRSLEIQQQWEFEIAALVASRLGVDEATDMRPALVGTCAVGALRVATNAWLAGGGTAHLPSLVDNAMLLIAGGGDPARWNTGDGLHPREVVAAP